MFNINEVKKFISCGIQTNQIEEQNVFDNRLIYSLNKNNSFIRKTHFQRYKNTIVNNNDNQIINQKNKSIKPLEKFLTKNNGIFINISLKNNLSIINDLNKERIFKGNNHIRIMKKNKSYSYKKSIFSRNNNHRRN